MGKKGIWLGVAVVLLALSAWLMSRGDKEKPTVRPPKVEFPRYATPEESRKASERRTLPPLEKPGQEEGFRRKRDPMLVALPADPKRSALVFEMEALKESPVMKMWVDCMMSRDGRDRANMERMKERYGIDPLEDVDRIAVSSERLMLMQGSFEGARFDPEQWGRRTYGEKGVVYTDEDSGRVVAMWGDMMIVNPNSGNPEAVEDAIDRLESTDPDQKSLLDDYNAYGDVYGVLSPEDLAKMLGPDQEALAQKIQDVVGRVDLHLDASDDVAVVADVQGPSSKDLEDLSKSVGAALAVGRIKAKNDGDDKLAQLLDFAKVKPQGGRFAVDVALPLEALKDLGPCRRREPPRDRGTDRGDDGEPAPSPSAAPK